jgi:mannose-1-phosphate guanylyltransferase
MSSSPDDHIWGVVLAGGIGSRFWPASTPGRPKQLLPLGSGKPLVQETLDRIEPLIPLRRIRVLTGARLAEAIRSIVPALKPEHFLLEPRAAGTAPILAWAAVEIERVDPDGIMVSLHSDHVIRPPDVFRRQLQRAARLASSHRRLFTLGAVPDRPETGFGYIRVGNPLPADSVAPAGGGFEVDRFVEKPDVETATAYLSEGGYLWNTGIFVWRARDLLDEFERHTPEIAHLIPLLRDGDIEGFFARVPSLSIDEGLLERSDRVGVVPADFEWDDIGAWDAVFRTQRLDPHGNAIIGDGHAIDTDRTAIVADDGPVVAFGVEDLVIVRTSGVTFVTHRSRAARLKELLAQLPEHIRTLE